MAVQAVVSVVIHKLDMLKEELVTIDRLIVNDLKEIKEALKETPTFLIDPEDKKVEEDDRVKEYLRTVYHVEDVIEKFAFRIAYRRKKFGFLMNYALFFRNLNSLGQLRWKLKRIMNKIKELNSGKPIGLEEATVRSIPSLRQETDYRATHVDINGFGPDQYPEKIEEEGSEPNTDGESEIIQSKFVEPNRNLQKYCSTAAETFRSWSTGDHMRQPKLLFSYSYDEDYLGIFGFTDQVRQLVDRLTRKNEFLIRIVGEVGSGKTTLARAAYGIRNIKQIFKCRAWVYVPKEYNKKDLLLSLLKEVGTSKDQGVMMTEQLLETKLADRLKEKKYLIVLDNVWKREIWDEIKSAFEDTGNGSKIVFTTSDSLVGDCGDLRNHKHDFRLKDEESWSIFLKKASLGETSESITDQMREKILDICNGLALHIVLLGGLLSTKQISSDGWSQILDSQLNWSTEEILSLSYKDLPVHSKLCLLYLALFPKETDIPVRRLLRLWLAEGFVGRSEKKVPEDEVQELFEDLVKRNIIQISQLRSDGSARRCQLQGVVHDYLFRKATGIGLFHIHRFSDNSEAVGPFGVRRLIEYVDIKKFDALDISKLQRLRSLVSFNFQKKDTPAKGVGRFVCKIIESRFSLLRVLDLEGVYKPNLPENLGHLFHLRYLGLRWTFLDALPPSVGDLHYLEMLDLKHTYINSLPESIWKLKHLRHMNLNEMRLDMPMQPHRLLKGLLTLWGLFVDHKSLVKDGLNRLCDLRELGITFDLISSKDLVDWIANLTALQYLRLRSRDDRGCPSQLGWKPLSNLKELTHLYLLGNLGSLPPKSEFPQGVKVLTLSVSQFNEDPMLTLSQLPSLTVLKLLANSYLGEEMDCPAGGFAKLRTLKLWMLKKLKEWRVGEGAMQSLKEVNIRCCKNLKNIPDRLLKLNTLEELVITNMPAPFIDDVQFNKLKDTLLTINCWDVTPLPWENDDAQQCNNGHPVVRTMGTDTELAGSSE